MLVVREWEHLSRTQDRTQSGLKHFYREVKTMATGMMSSRNSWCMLAIRGIIALLFGLAVFIRPNIFNSFGFLFGIYALVDGIMVAGMAMDDHDRHGRWWVMLLGSLVGIVFGLL